ncbi:acetyl-coenzyme A synthetase [Virgibacillus pantothenticus]|uniref:acetate--CoA ligase n=2 Tax=Bacillaceae TaxID=186817 RepID=A0A0L0QTK0_VIRPA|nr:MULTISPECIES: acetate--CoA ligase [Virgibacillus]API91145.1 acetate--CoA ligase [Virgibacillus sp. 6R]KNE21901.1 acetyl-CoA synthetase [Virgibacillus pantothenticus]MBS7429135.1 acetate--CoA ligase [Virgibacillus sp. 19R1-5]MBU8566837.1 acetate--CoA ligase [Virgibacillus pantothenticus]MBU8600470.1 acetate--CoA ligase [Virgibacillus pantothenticus]
MSKTVASLHEKPNMPSYEEACANFSWKEVEKTFSWYQTGKVNMAYEAIDRHAESWRKNKVALYYSDLTRDEKYTFQDLKYLSNKFGNVLKKIGVQKGDRVFLFLPRQPETYISLFGILKIGAIAGPLFEAFMEQAVHDRLENSEASTLITTSELLSRVPYEKLPHLKDIILIGDGDIPENTEHTNFYHYETEMEKSPRKLGIEWMDREDGMILHYTSGSTGKPKGVLHVHNAMIQQYQTAKWVLDLKEDDVYWCTADPGWVTGTSYGIFGPWLNGASSVIRGGRFTPEDWYSTIEKYRVTIWYSAPTAFRRLMAVGDELIQKYDLSSLRHILSVGEPLNAEVIHWGRKVYGLHIHDHWWMTETGGILISNYPTMNIKPGSMGKPFPGIEAAILDGDGNEVPRGQMGRLCIKTGWPSMMRRIWKNEEKWKEYFALEGWYISGDLATMDEDGYIWFQGRDDDVIMTSGERVGPFEVESKLIEHPAVAEAAVIGKPDPVRGEIVKAFVALRDGFEKTENLEQELRQFVKEGLAAHAAPREIEIRDFLPKTRSGKIMRRVLKAWELNLPAGDLSTMEK